jgi:FSR family fosmidomycin resistance protein-like MFS transporter
MNLSDIKPAVFKPSIEPAGLHLQGRTQLTTRPTLSLFLLSWTHFLNDGASSYLPGVLPAVLVALHIPLKMVGVVMAALLIGQALQPLCGWFSDEVGGRAFVIAGAGLSALAGGLVGVMPGYWSLLLILLLIGAGSAMFHPQALVAVRRLATKRQGLSLSAFLIGGELGRGLWPLLASIVVVSQGMTGLVLMAIPAAVSLPFILHRIPSIPPRHPDLPRSSLRRHFPALSVLVVYSSLRATVMYSLATFLPLLWVLRGGSLVTGASLVTVLLTVGIIGNLAGGHLTDVLGRRTITTLSALLSAIFLALLLLSHGFVMWLILGILGIVVFATMPAQILIGQDILPENRSLGSGLALGFSNAVGAFAMIVLGWLAARWGIPAVLWINVGFCVLAMMVAPLLSEARHNNEELMSSL